MNKDTVNVKQYQIGNASCGNEQVDVKMCPFFFETAHSGRENVQNIKQLLITCIFADSKFHKEADVTSKSRALTEVQRVKRTTLPL